VPGQQKLTTKSVGRSTSSARLGRSRPRAAGLVHLVFMETTSHGIAAAPGRPGGGRGERSRRLHLGRRLSWRKRRSDRACTPASAGSRPPDTRTPISLPSTDTRIRKEAAGKPWRPKTTQPPPTQRPSDGQDRGPLSSFPVAGRCGWCPRWHPSRSWTCPCSRRIPSSSSASAAQGLAGERPARGTRAALPSPHSV
jgi:hypothetical protein